MQKTACGQGEMIEEIYGREEQKTKTSGTKSIVRSTDKELFANEPNESLSEGEQSISWHCI